AQRPAGRGAARYAGAQAGVRLQLAAPLHPLGHCRVDASDSPVSSRLFRLDRIFGQPFDTPSIRFAPLASASCTMVSFTSSPSGSSVKVHCEWPSMLMAGVNLLVHLWES